MKLKIKNVGIVKEAELLFDGLTVVAGHNNTGKSTIAKSLYVLYDIFHDIEKNIKKEKKKLILSVIRPINIRKHGYIFPENYNREVFYDKIIDMLKNKNEKNIIEYLNEMYNIHEHQFNSTDYYEIFDNLKDELVSIYNLTNQEIKNRIAKNALNNIFNNQIKNINSNEGYEIDLNIKEKNIVIVGNGDVNVKEDIDLYANPIYMDDPTIIDKLNIDLLGLNMIHNYNVKLRNLLMISDKKLSVNDTIKELVNEKKFEEIFNKINFICDGEIVIDKRVMKYKSINSNESISLGNLSMGLKTFVIIKTLLINGIIINKGLIILDEPEIHLHPEWQIIFAEIIVLLQKAYDLTILINTHSPYFLHALHIYSLKYKTIDETHFYFSSLDDNGLAMFEFKDDNVEDLYKSLAQPFNKLELDEYEL